jgi:acyl carrier protein
VPAGAAGELYAGGAGLARGYHGRPDLTAERFVPDPFSGEPGARLYRTGDLARYLPDGRIEFIGRRDFQVKVRGFRIELGEIEAALAAHGAVRQCVVVARGQGAEKQLVAYAVLGEGQALSAAEMRSYLREKLPDYMMPAHLVALDAFPLTPNGKVDRRALPAPAAATAEASDGYVAPRTPVEELLAGIWGDVLDVKLVGVRDDFFDLGGHSLLATQVVSRVREAFRTSLPIRLLFESPTIEALAAYLESDRRASAETAAPPLAPVPRDAALPLSFAQQRLWFLDQLEPGSAAYNIPAAVRLAGRLDASALERALAGVVKRHEALRTTFVAEGGQPRQSLSPAGPFALPLVDLSDRPAPAREEEARRLTEEEGRRPFDLARGPLLRALLLKLDDEEHIILLTMHHIVSDAWSMGLLIRELTALYEAHVEDRPPTLPELPIQYADFAVWQRGWLTGETLAEQLAYWRRQLGGELPSLRLSAETPGGPAGGGSHGFSLRPDLTESLKSLSRGEGTTLFMTLLAAFKSLLCLHAGQEDIVVGTPVAGRTRAEIEPLIGFFVNTLVLRTDLSGDPTFRELLRRVREVTLGAYAHQDVPFERLVEELRPDRAAAESPLFQVAFTLDNTRHEAVELPGLTLSPWAVETGATRYGLIAALLDAEAGLFGSLQYDTRLFSAAAVARLAEHYETLLERVAAEPETRLSELRDLLAEAERRREDARRQEFREARGRRLRDAKSKAAAQPSAQEELVP